MRSIEDLLNLHKNIPGFVVGNGLSRIQYPMKSLYLRGVMLTCNLAFLNVPTDYLIFWDDEIIPKCCEFPGKKIIYYREMDGKIGEAIQKASDKIYFYYRDDPKKRNPTNLSLKRGSSGYIAAQMAFRMGCNPIIFVGCDCKKGNLYINEDLEGGVPQKYLNFKNEFQNLIKLAQDKGRQCYKLGDHGTLEVPVITLEEIEERYRVLRTEGNMDAPRWGEISGVVPGATGKEP